MTMDLKLTKDEQAKANALRKLDLTDEEIFDVIQADREIDHGGDPFPQTTEQKKVTKSMAQADRTPTAYKFTKRERKADNDKREIMQVIDDALCDLVDNVEVTNPERELLFFYNGKKYKVVLSAPRT